MLIGVFGVNFINGLHKLACVAMLEKKIKGRVKKWIGRRYLFGASLQLHFEFTV